MILKKKCIDNSKLYGSAYQVNIRFWPCAARELITIFTVLTDWASAVALVSYHLSLMILNHLSS